MLVDQKKIHSSTRYTSNDNNDNIDNAYQIDPRAHMIGSSTEYGDADRALDTRTLEPRTNIMPALDRLLPVLNAFGNIGHSGHKEGGKAPVPA
jgi:hypothetical protein